MTVRLRASAVVRKPPARTLERVREKPQTRRVFVGGRWARIPVWNRAALPRGVVRGPALILDYGSTTLVPAGWTMRLEESGTLVISRSARP